MYFLKFILALLVLATPVSSIAKTQTSKPMAHKKGHTTAVALLSVAAITGIVLVISSQSTSRPVSS